MDGHARGLVDGHHGVVLHQNGELFVWNESSLLGNFLLQGILRGANRGNSNVVPKLDPGLSACTSFVHTHLTRADDAVDVGLGHPFEVAEQKIIQALPHRLGVDFDKFGAWCAIRL